MAARRMVARTGELAQRANSFFHEFENLDLFKICSHLGIKHIPVSLLLSVRLLPAVFDALHTRTNAHAYEHTRHQPRSLAVCCVPPRQIR